MRRKSIDSCFCKPVIPVVWDQDAHNDLRARSSNVFLQGGSLGYLERILKVFSIPKLEIVSLFVHVDLASGLEKSEPGIEYLAGVERITGVVTVHHHLVSAARRLGLLSIVRLFLSD